MHQLGQADLATTVRGKGRNISPKSDRQKGGDLSKQNHIFL